MRETRIENEKASEMRHDQPQNPGDDPAPTPEKKPWPMSRVLAAIVVFVVCYTLIMIYFRKETDMFYPYEEAQAEVLGNLLSSEGWEPLPEAYTVPEFRLSAGELGLTPREIALYETEDAIGLEIGEHATTPLVLDGVSGPAALAAGEPYQAELRWEEKEEAAYPDKLNFYKRNREIIIFPPHGRIRPVESAEPVTRFLIPPEQLSAGDYTVFLYTEDGLQGWNLTIEE